MNALYERALQLKAVGNLVGTKKLNEQALRIFKVALPADLQNIAEVEGNLKRINDAMQP